MLIFFKVFQYFSITGYLTILMYLEESIPQQRLEEINDLKEHQQPIDYDVLSFVMGQFMKEDISDLLIRKGYHIFFGQENPSAKCRI
jgi:hypothetical protein